PISAALAVTYLNFFFQAEDGIRDKLVTGVQTCALPISIPLDGRPRQGDRLDPDLGAALLLDLEERTGLGVLPRQAGLLQRVGPEIGRASCRERVWFGGGAGSL